MPQRTWVSALALAISLAGSQEEVVTVFIVIPEVKNM